MSRDGASGSINFSLSKVQHVQDPVSLPRLLVCACCISCFFGVKVYFLFILSHSPLKHCCFNIVHRSGSQEKRPGKLLRRHLLLWVGKWDRSLDIPLIHQFFVRSRFILYIQKIQTNMQNKILNCHPLRLPINHVTSLWCLQLS